ncbi:PAS domain S-box protein [Marinibaculum pumilum]|uniref:histidine kinase n=1 Tax=Marinibaculum pumilum TaxID=1766165 RepID=A0ABV7L5R1_9PROT
MAIAKALVTNLGLLSLAAILVFLLLTRLARPAEGRGSLVLIGVVLGGLAAAIILFPIPALPGTAFDLRATPIILAGALAGAGAGFLAAIIAAAIDLKLAGPAAAGGIGAAFLCTALGSLYGWWRRRHRPEPGIGDAGIGDAGIGYPGIWIFSRPALLTLGVLTGLAVLPVFLAGIPAEAAGAPATGPAAYWPLLLLANAGGVLLLGSMLQTTLSVARMRDRYKVELETSRLARGTGGIGVWSYDYRSRQQTRDPIARQVLGLPDDDMTEGDAAIIRNLLLPEDLARFDRQMTDARRGTGPIELRFRIRTPAGEIRHIRTTTTYVGGTSEAPHLTIGVGIDETAEVRLRSEMALRGAALDAAGDGILIAEAGGDQPIVYANRRFLEITGYAEAEVIGLNCRFLNDGLRDQAALEDLRRAIAAGRPCTVVVQNARRDGSRFWNSVTISPLRDDDGRISHFIGTLTDLTGQISARLEAILVSAPDAILTVDEKQQVTSFNPAAERLFGWPREVILGRRVESLIPEDVRTRHRRLAAGYVGDADAQPGSMTGMRIISARRRDGSTFPALVSLARFIRDGRPAVAATAHDMTEIVTANDRLTQLSLDLSDQLKAAEDASAAKSQFLAHMSHELRTPLNAVLGFADLIRWTGPEEIGTERLSGYIDDIHRSGAQLLDLINDVLDLSKIESDGLPIRMEPCAPHLLVEAAVETIRPIAEARNIDLQVDVEASARIRCDRRAMHQCLLNLLSNAVKFSPVGRTVAVRVTQQPAQLCFAIRDDGPGISQEMVAQIGQPFLRGTLSHLSSNSGGTGLGLAITKRLLDRQNARLEVDSAPGAGSTFTIIVETATTASGDTTRQVDRPSQPAT